MFQLGTEFATICKPLLIIQLFASIKTMRLLKHDFLMKLNFSNERNTTLWTPFFCFSCDVSLSCLVFYCYPSKSRECLAPKNAIIILYCNFKESSTVKGNMKQRGQTLGIYDTKETSTKTSVFKIKTHLSNQQKNNTLIPVCRLVDSIGNEAL